MTKVTYWKRDSVWVYGFRGKVCNSWGGVAVSSRAEIWEIASPLPTGSRERKQEVGYGYKLSKPSFSDVFPPARLNLKCSATSPSTVVNWGQVFKCVSLWGTFSFTLPELKVQGLRVASLYTIRRKMWCWGRKEVGGRQILLPVPLMASL